MKRKYEDPEMRKKTGAASKKMWQNEEYRQKQIEIAKMVSQRPEVRKARIDGTEKRWNDPAAHEAHSDRMSGANNPRAKKVIRLSNGFVYGCIKDAATDMNVSRNTMYTYCNKHKDFMFYDEWIAKQNDLVGDSIAI